VNGPQRAAICAALAVGKDSTTRFEGDQTAKEKGETGTKLEE
jgi:hypothetical protein